MGCCAVLVAVAGCQQNEPPGVRAGGVTESGPSREPPPETRREQALPSGGAQAADAADGRAAASIGSEQAAGNGMPDPEMVDRLYESWPQPDLVLFITGQQHGYIEPCGCTGLENQKGGMARRHMLLMQLADRGWPVIPVDAGNQVRRFGRQAEIKFQVTADALKKMGYEAVTLGIDDLQLTSGELLVTTTPATDDETTPFLCANASILDPSLTPSFKIVERGGKKVGITGVIGNEWRSEIRGSDIVHKAAEEALQEVVPQLTAANCDVLVLLAHATLEESEELGKRFSDFDVVISAGGDGDPAYQPERIGTDGPLLVRVGVKGMHVGLIALFEGSEPRFRYQRIPLTSRFGDSDEMLALLASYQETLADQGFEGLAIRALPHPTGRQFVGSDACAECHEDAYDIWKESWHARATDSIEHPPNERGEIQRHHDPECISCHVTGWHPQRYYPYQSGYLSLEKTPKMKGSGCENCHGPGSQHVAAESGEIEASDELLEKLQDEMRLPLAKARDRCLQCHDLDNSPEFHEEGAFERYWEQVAH